MCSLRSAQRRRATELCPHRLAFRSVTFTTQRRGTKTKDKQTTHTIPRTDTLGWIMSSHARGGRVLELFFFPLFFSFDFFRFSCLPFFQFSGVAERFRFAALAAGSDLPTSLPAIGLVPLLTQIHQRMWVKRIGRMYVAQLWTHLRNRQQNEDLSRLRFEWLAYVVIYLSERVLVMRWAWAVSLHNFISIQSWSNVDADRCASLSLTHPSDVVCVAFYRRLTERLQCAVFRKVFSHMVCRTHNSKSSNSRILGSRHLVLVTSV